MWVLYLCWKVVLITDDTNTQVSVWGTEAWFSCNFGLTTCGQPQLKLYYYYCYCGVRPVCGVGRRKLLLNLASVPYWVLLDLICLQSVRSNNLILSSVAIIETAHDSCILLTFMYWTKLLNLRIYCLLQICLRAAGYPAADFAGTNQLLCQHRTYSFAKKEIKE